MKFSKARCIIKLYIEFYVSVNFIKMWRCYIIFGKVETCVDHQFLEMPFREDLICYFGRYHPCNTKFFSIEISFVMSSTMSFDRNTFTIRVSFSSTSFAKNH